MRSRFMISLAAAAGILAGCATDAPKSARSISAGEFTRVKVENGIYEGYLDGGIYTFKGIQYAKAERFMPPQAPDSFEGVRMAKCYGPKAMQGQTFEWSEKQTDYSFGNNFVMEPMSEQECLVLNVWTPGINDNASRPVFVWVHGGGYSSGSGHDLPCYEGLSLAEKGDIVVVNLNHRLNVLGYMDLRGLGGKYENSVNLGQQDIVKALEWIHRNIAAFGGDPENVTVGGQSGGGGKVSTLLAMPSAKGLIDKAVVQSGSTLKVGESEQTIAAGIEFAKALGVVPGPDADFSRFSYQELVAAAGRGRMGPTMDGKIVAEQPFDGVGSQLNHDVPMLIGTNFNEMVFDINFSMTEDEAVEALAKTKGENARAFYDAFKVAYPDADPKEATYVDTWSRANAIKQASAKYAEGGADVYLYLFTWAPDLNALGASHGMELPFMFNNVSLQREMTGGNDRAYAMQDIVSDLWLSFIKTGKPTASGCPEWPAFTPQNGATMILDDVCELRSHHDDAIL